MDDMLAHLYEALASKKQMDSPQYQKALVQWRSAQCSEPSDLEDAAELREYEWGYLTFLSGLRLGLELGQSLSGMWMNLS